jgi:Fic/DOC family
MRISPTSPAAGNYLTRKLRLFPQHSDLGVLQEIEMPDYKWKPIEPLSDADHAINLATIRPLYEAWRTSKKRLEDLSRQRLEEFNHRLVRRLSIETGILERLYDLDRGTTEALIAHGFAEDLVSHSSTNLPPASLIDILRDQESAVHLVLDCVARKRELTKGFLHELHSILTRHQETTTAVTQFGNRMEIRLVRGKFKELPNNPRRPDGSMHEYCPPIHVEAEVDRLIDFYDSYLNEDPILVAAWLHHRFTQIHPYQDGNGRVARAIVTMVLLRHELLPLVIDRDLRKEYLDSLQLADAGNLSSLVEIFSRLEKTAILQALSLDVDAEVSRQESLASAVIASLSDKFQRRRAALDAEMLVVNNVALVLREQARVTIGQRFSELRNAIFSFHPAQGVKVENGGADVGTSHWYKFQVVQTAQEAGKYANFAQSHYFTKGSISIEEERLVFVVSFHHVGYELTGVMEATAFAQLESRNDSEELANFTEGFRPCSVEPFVFTYKTKTKDVADSFLHWLDAALAVALKEYGDRL